MSGSRQHAILWLVCVAAIAFLHLPFLQLPYYWDEAGYYVPAALDLAQHGHLVPQNTLQNPHPPLFAMYLAAAYKIFGFTPLVTRLAVCVLAGTALYAMLLLATLVIPAGAGLWAAVLLALSPLFYAQSTLAHLDVAATAATLLALYFFLRGQMTAYLIAATVLCLTRETGAALVVALAIYRRSPKLLLPLAPLAGWFAFLRLGTGNWLGDPGFVSYNVVEALNPLRFLTTLARRLHFLLLVDFRWLLAIPLFWSWRKDKSHPVLWLALATQVLVMCLFGGAILDRYLLPALALFFLLSLRSAHSLQPKAYSLVAGATLLAGIAGWFWNPPYPFPYEENLAYADFVKLHQAAAAKLPEFRPGTRILSAWPATAEFTQPELGYTKTPARMVVVDDFSEEALDKTKAEDFDVIFLYSREWRPEWNLMQEWPVLEAVRGRLYGRHPQARTEWIMLHYNLVSLGGIRLGGQWVEWLGRGSEVQSPKQRVQGPESEGPESKVQGPMSKADLQCPPWTLDFRPRTLDLGFRRGRRQSARLNLGLESGPLVRAVAERLVFRMPAAAQPNGSAPRKVERSSGRITNGEFPFDADRAVVVDSDFSHAR